MNKIAQFQLAARLNDSLVAARRDGKLFLKCAGQVALVGKTGHEGGIGEGVTLHQQTTRQTNAGLYQIGVWRDAGRAREAADQLKAAETAKPGKRLKRDFLFGASSRYCLASTMAGEPILPGRLAQR